MYIDGHEREDVVAYQHEMLERFAGYQKDTVQYDQDGDPVFGPKESGSLCLILMTHDESTFYANGCQKTKGTHASDKVEPEKKGEGVLIMIFYESFWFTKLGLVCSPGLAVSKIFNNFLSLLIPSIDTEQTHCCRHYVT